MRIKYLTAGESHGPELNAIIEGIPSNFEISKEFIDNFLERRQKGSGSGGRMNIEKDAVSISSGVVNNKSTGGPIALKIINKDWKNWQSKEIEPFNVPRPGHADLVGTLKYKHTDIRHSLERASARETAIRTAVGAVCSQVLHSLNINIVGFVSSIGTISIDLNQILNYEELRNKVINSNVSCPDESISTQMEEAIKEARKNKDTLGGAITCIAENFPPGCGSYVHFDRKLDAKIASSMMSVQSVKAVEIGKGVESSKSFGTKVQDQIELENKSLKRISNNLGGFEGGMSTGEKIVITSFLKPISTTLTPIKSVDLASKKETKTEYERSDTCAVPRAVPIFESVLAIDLLNALLIKTGGDSKQEISERLTKLREYSIDDFNLANETWQMNYEIE
jgi:chorismate synthase